MPEELKVLISFIEKKYQEIDRIWRENEKFLRCNFKNVLVKEIYSSPQIQNMIFDYRNFLNDSNLYLSRELQGLDVKKISFRVKTQNSMEFKIDNYNKRHNSGEETVMKCLNDLCGFRIVLPNFLSYEQINTLVTEMNKKIRCVDSSKSEGYVATHLYFKIDNYHLPWELQIWDEAHEKSNIVCHERYKQDYTKWENENKWR